MNLQDNGSDFEDLIEKTSERWKLPSSAVRRDFYLVLMLKNLQNSEYCNCCVFKGGTSISKCYPNTINRFSEDIDLTYIPEDGSTDKMISKVLKKIEEAIIQNAHFSKNDNERNDRNKSSDVWFEDNNREGSRIKLEIGSSVKPEPYEKKVFKSYIHEYLEVENFLDVIEEYGLAEVELNVLKIERTFIDKVFAVRRHALCGTLNRKVRHIYDVNKLMKTTEIQKLIMDKKVLKEIIRKTKETDSYYIQKRKTTVEYNAMEPFEFSLWKHLFNDEIEKRYETLHEDLLYSKEKQNFNEALESFIEIDRIMGEIDE